MDSKPSFESLQAAADALVDALKRQFWCVGYAAVVPDDGALVVRVLERTTELEAAVLQVTEAPVRWEIVDDDSRVVTAPSTMSRSWTGSALAGVRRRPSMYYGTARPHAMPLSMLGMAAAYLVRQGPADESLTVDLTIHANESFTVADDGPGLSMEPHASTGRPMSEMTMTRFASGSSRAPESLAIVTAMSERSELRICRDGAAYRQIYEGDRPVMPAEFVGRTDDHGTSVTFSPSPAAVGVTPSFPMDWHEQLPRLLSVILSAEHVGARVRTNDERTGRTGQFEI